MASPFDPEARMPDLFFRDIIRLSTCIHISVSQTGRTQSLSHSPRRSYDARGTSPARVPFHARFRRIVVHWTLNCCFPLSRLDVFVKAFIYIVLYIYLHRVWYGIRFCWRKRSPCTKAGAPAFFPFALLPAVVIVFHSTPISIILFSYKKSHFVGSFGDLSGILLTSFPIQGFFNETGCLHIHAMIYH